MNYPVRLGALLLLCVLLSGCLYPKEMRKQNQAASGEYLPVVQNAIDEYKAKTGVLPIKNSTETTPHYEKYPIDFKKLEGRYLSEVPSNAFEKGGTATYVLVDVETKPTVKMMDIPSFQHVLELQRDVDSYKIQNGALPFGEASAPGFYQIDYGKLNRAQLEVPSVYTRSMLLPLLLTEGGEVVIDYAPEIMRLIDKKGLQSQLDSRQDLRELLVQESYFVPARSAPYRWQDGSPVPSGTLHD
ncbi:MULTISPECIES: hypothetical protein [Paenibacillus]|uniref:hypothetical protein n=1 Tax=Paenibacillus TaxID=44249 RepID=UPI0022B8EC0C|nr:hypothetical protein [Paenibacillus caseinilyticus]MCZ8520545.1 hypothetical protein [Paenibacillus caseinilyticus]